MKSAKQSVTYPLSQTHVQRTLYTTRKQEIPPHFPENKKQTLSTHGHNLSHLIRGGYCAQETAAADMRSHCQGIDYTRSLTKDETPTRL